MLGTVTRIISGHAGSLTLQVPKSGTRPTSDRVREAIFSALEARDAIDDAVVLDLYAGSGALGLEAASRGARSVALVERGAPAVQVAKKNAAAVVKAVRGSGPAITVHPQSVQAFLEARLARAVAGGFEPDEYHLVFVDPPYDLPEPELASNLLALAPLLAPDAVVVVERSSRTPEPVWPTGIAVERRKDYGETTVWWASTAHDPAD